MSDSERTAALRTRYMTDEVVTACIDIIVTVAAEAAMRVTEKERIQRGSFVAFSGYIRDAVIDTGIVHVAAVTIRDRETILDALRRVGLDLTGGNHALATALDRALPVLGILP